MPTIKNMSYGALAISISDENQIVLGPRESKDLSSDDFETEPVQKSLREGLTRVLTSQQEPAKKAKPKPNSI